MEKVLFYIGNHWVEWLFTLCLFLLSCAYRSLLLRWKEEHVKTEAIAEGIQSLLRESIVRNYNKYKVKGYCPIYAKESIKKAYKAYHDLEGNDVATGLYNEMLAMPTEMEDNHEDE